MESLWRNMSVCSLKANRHYENRSEAAVPRASGVPTSFPEQPDRREHPCHMRISVSSVGLLVVGCSIVYQNDSVYAISDRAVHCLRNL